MGHAGRRCAVASILDACWTWASSVCVRSMSITEMKYWGRPVASRWADVDPSPHEAAVARRYRFSSIR